NQRPRSYARLGIEPPALCAVKPDLIWLGITGFGPEHDEAAYDPVLQARSGFMELTGEANGSPLVFGLPMVDLGAAEHGYSEVMKALYRRATTGPGTPPPPGASRRSTAPTASWRGASRSSPAPGCSSRSGAPACRFPG